MVAEILDGKAVARQLQNELREQTARFVAETGVTPCLAAILIGDDPASAVYVRNKERGCQQAGLTSRLYRLEATVDEAEVLSLIARLNDDPAVHGILVQSPFPRQIRPERVVDAVSPRKDVDAFHPENVGRLVQGRQVFLPCTPAGILELLRRYQVETSGRHVVVLGRSDIVGKPMASLLLQRGPLGDATVTICHSRTQNLPELTRLADILIVAIGRAKFVTAEMVKPGAVVVDVGINRTDAGLVGDVDFEAVRQVAGRITPVPGGVGPLTVAMLLANTLRAAQWQTRGETL